MDGVDNLDVGDARRDVAKGRAEVLERLPERLAPVRGHQDQPPSRRREWRGLAGRLRARDDLEQGVDHGVPCQMNGRRRDTFGHENPTQPFS